MLRAVLTLILGISHLALGSALQDKQAVLAPIADFQTGHAPHVVDPGIIAAIEKYSDPVTALLSLQPKLADELAQPRLLQLLGDKQPEWMTEGDKLRLRKAGKKFTDITDHHEFYAQQVGALAGKASKVSSVRSRIIAESAVDMPGLKHQRLVKPLFKNVSTQRMHDVLKHMTGYYNRYYGGTHGALSATWLHDHIAKAGPLLTSYIEKRF